MKIKGTTVIRITIMNVQGYIATIWLSQHLLATPYKPVFY